MSMHPSHTEDELRRLEPNADLHKAVLGWTLIRCDSAARKPALQLYNYLRAPDVFWTAAAPPFCAAIASRFSCIAEIAAQLLGNKLPALPMRLSQWRDYAAQIGEFLQTQNGGGWEALLVETAESQNQLAIALVSQSLEEAVRGMTVPDGLTTCIRDLLQIDMQYWDNFLLPPAASRSHRAADYLHSSSVPELFLRLQAIAAPLDDLLLPGSEFDENDATGDPAAEETAIPDKLDLVCMATLNDLRQTLSQASAGWPIDVHYLSACLNRLSQRLSTLPEPMPFATPRWQEEILMASKEIEAVRGERVSVPTSADSPAFMAAEPSPKASDSHSTEAFRTTEGSELATVIDDVAPSVDSSRSWRPTGSYTGLAQERQRADLPAWQRTLTGLVGKLWQTGAEPAAEFARQLEQWLEQLRCEDLTELDPAAERRLLSNLVYLDDMVFQAPRPANWINEARDSLRNLLLAGGHYVVLDQQLLGRPIGACSELAEPVGFLVATRYPLHHIIHIQQPGYAMKMADGSQQILRRAKVLLVR